MTGLEQQFNTLVRDYSERIYWHVRRFTCSHEDADDLVQDIFVKAWKALPDFRGDAQPSTWLYRIATNEALNFLRRQKVRSLFSAEPLTDALERRIDEDPYFDGDAAERQLSKAVQRLPDKQRTVFILRYYDELPYEEMSRILGTSVGALKASYHIAQEKVRAALEKTAPAIEP